MLNGAMVLMIIAGILGLPAVACSAACAGIGSFAASHDVNATAGATILESLKTLAIIASFGSIIVGALIKKIGKIISGACSLVFALIFVLLLFQANFLGILPSIMLVIAAVMIFVAPEQQFRDVTRVEKI
jgi:hypothetical protein